MKIGIFFQSVTGNTKHVAELIEQGVRESGYGCEIHDIHNLDFLTFGDYDLIGFGAPVFAWREPKLMREFILNLPQLKGKYCFLFCSCAGGEGNFALRMAKNLKKKGMIVFATATYVYPSSYTCWRKEEGNNDVIPQIQIDKTVEFGMNLISKYERIVQGIENIPKIKRSLKATIIGNISSDWALRIFLGTIQVDRDNCTQCGACVKICPHDAIALDPFPIITKNLCTGCCGCINICPVRALNSKKTKGKEQYKFKESLIE